MPHKVLKEGWANFQRNSYLSAAAVGIMAITLGLLMALVGFRFLTNAVVDEIQGKVDIIAYFEHSASESAIQTVKEELEGQPNVAQVTYTSREQAEENYLAEQQDGSVIEQSFEILDENPLHAHLNVLAVDPTQYASIDDFLNQGRFQPLLWKVNFFENQEVIDEVLSISGALNLWGIVTAIALGVLGIFVTFNTIRLTIYSQKQEIEIMRLVGASNWHIRGPYVMEGGYYGFFAGLIALVIMYPLIYVLSGKFAVYEPSIDIFAFFLSNIIFVALGVLIVGVLLGMISSYIAIRKHLKI